MPAAKKNYREMPDEDLAKELEGLRRSLFNLRVRKVTDVVERPSEFRALRREIARILTEKRARELKKQGAGAGAGKPAGAAAEAPRAKSSTPR